jgi:hypothetical protein
MTNDSMLTRAPIESKSNYVIKSKVLEGERPSLTNHVLTFNINININVNIPPNP